MVATKIWELFTLPAALSQVAIAEADGDVLWHTMLRALFGEIGDKTFWLALLLCAFCPWEGIRDCSRLVLQQMLVYLGAACGLLTHYLMLYFMSSEGWQQWLHNCWVLEVLSGCVLALLCLRAYLCHVHDGHAEDGETDPLQKETEKGGATPSYRKDAFSFPSLAAVQQEGKTEYGATGASSSGYTADGWLGHRPTWTEDQTISTALAFMFSFLLAFSAEAEDKSWWAVLAGQAHQPSIWTTIGAFLGLLPSLFLASLMGHLLWFQLEAKSVRFLAMCVCGGLSLCSFSQALLHITALEPHVAGLTPSLEPPRTGNLLATVSTGVR